LQWNGLNHLQLIDNEIDKMALDSRSPIERPRFARLQNQFLQQRRNIHHRAGSGQSSHESGSEIDGPHGDHTGHGDAVRNLGRDPHSSLSRHYPASFTSVHRHYTSAGVRELVFRVAVHGNDIAMRKVVRHGRDLRGKRGADMYIYIVS